MNANDTVALIVRPVRIAHKDLRTTQSRPPAAPCGTAGLAAHCSSDPRPQPRPFRFLSGPYQRDAESYLNSGIDLS